MSKPILSFSRRLPRRPLGNTGIEVTPVGMGTLTMGFSQRDLSIEEGSGLIVRAWRSGINFFDTAQYYETYRYLRPALDQIREDIRQAREDGSVDCDAADFPVICSKTLAADHDEAAAAVRECLEELGLKQIDIFLLHEIRGVRDFEARAGAWSALQEARAAGLVKAIGISTHHADACARMAKTPACDAVFALINKNAMGIRTIDPDGNDRAASREEMEAAITACSFGGKGVFTMKAFGGGNLISDYRACLDYASAIPGNGAVMIGMGSAGEIDAAVRYFSGALEPGYTPDISRKRMMVDQSDCEGCGTCKSRCASHAIHWNENGLAEIDQSKCVRCGYCAPVCPVRAIIFLTK